VKAQAWAVLMALAMPLAARANGCGRFPSAEFEGPDRARVEGRYANATYGYAVKAPPGRVGHVSPAPAPNHGFGVVLSWTPRAYLYVDGSYESLEGSTLEEQSARFVRADAQRVLWTRSTKARLGGLDAVRYVARYECPGLQGVYITDEVRALSRDGGTVYTVALLTTAERYHADRKAFEAMVRSFSLQGRS